MRLSTDAARDEARAHEVLAAAIEAGVDLLDTADAYALDAREVGHNERLIGDVLARLGARARVKVVTKGGLVRPGGAWVPDGRARHLAAAARASRERLGHELDLYLLHAVDPRTPLATSVRALARLRDEGVVRAIGLSNVGVAQLEEALAIAPIAAVEIELSPWKLDALRGGLVEMCATRGIRVLAHRPLGGAAGAARLARDPVLAAIAERVGATPAEVAIAWLRGLGVVPLPGATTIDHVQSIARAAAITLDAETMAAMRARFVEVAARAAPADASPRGGADVVVIAGMPGAGKTTLAADYVARGYARLNRDDRGGSLVELARALDRALAAGATAVVLDNTYPTRASRAPVVEVARRHGATVRCVSLDVPIEEAQARAVMRMLDRHGRLLEPGEIAASASAGEIGPSAQFRYRREHEAVAAGEGFDEITSVRPERRAAASGAPGIIVELDDLIWRGRPTTPDAIELHDGVAAQLSAWAASGAIVAGTSWQPDGMDAARLDAMRARLRELTGVAIELACCAHAAGPPVCWCRKPMPGLALWLARVHAIDLARTIVVGRGAADRGFALRAGVRYADIADGWPVPQT